MIKIRTQIRLGDIYRYLAIHENTMIDGIVGYAGAINAITVTFIDGFVSVYQFDDKKVSRISIKKINEKLKELRKDDQNVTQ